MYGRGMAGRRAWWLGVWIAAVGCGDREVAVNGTDETGASDESGALDDPLSPCMVAIEIDPDFCRVLSTGLLLRTTDAGVVAEQLDDDGGRTFVATLPDTSECPHVLAHDPVQAKLWWAEGNATVHQLDLAGGSQDWQRFLGDPNGHTVPWVFDLRALDGALFVAGSYEAAESGVLGPALLTRLELDGTLAWTRSDLPGYGFSEANDGSPLDGIQSLFELDTGLGLVGGMYGVDSEALTLAVVAPATGEQVWSESLIRDTYGYGVRVDGYAGLIASSITELGPEPDLEVVAEVVVRSATNAVLASFARTWPDPSWSPTLPVYVVGERIAEFVPDPLEPTVVERDASGAVLCTTPLPELAVPDAGPFAGPSVSPIAGVGLVIRTAVGEDRRAFLLRR